MIKKKTIRQAVEIIREINLKFHKDSSKKKNLLEGDNGGSLFLQISLKKIPNTKNIKMIKMPLPNSLPLDGACLITGDLDKKNHKADIEPDVLHYKELLSNCGVTSISEVITLRQLRTEYKSYEARQLLLGAYDTFIADKKIAGTLPKVLGRHFFKKRKFPIKIDLKSEDLKRDIEYALSRKVLFLSGHGNTCALEVAHLDMEDSKIIENVMIAVKTLSEKLPGSWDNIMGLYLRMAKSKAMPIYMSYDDASNVKFDAEKKLDITVDDLSTLPNASVRVYSDGRVECTRKFKDGEPEDFEDDVSSAEEEESHNLRRKKKKSEKNSLPECDQLNDDVKCQNVSFQGDSQVKGSKKLKRSRKQSGRIEETIALSNDFEDSQVIKPPSEIRKIKKSKKDTTVVKNVTNTPNDSEDSQAAKSLTATKKIKKSKKEITNEEGVDFFPDVSEDSQTVNSVVETKKLKKNKKQIINMKQAELDLKQTEDEPLSNQNKKANKRKRVDSESASAEHIKENKFEFKSPIPVQKKKKLEDDVKHNLSVKKARRNKMKENCLKSK